MNRDQTNQRFAQTDGQPAQDRPAIDPRDRRWWQRSWGAALMLAGAALLMGAVLTVWSEAAMFGG
ncbi:hypothetical protein J2X65_002505 [Ancylobacter sp. 3268]|uniref:hypothetical protein n=1 Tax=Ancylobacter sp. 3268 TaxID=2817752 RepID=UPI00285F0647|nr:hypothetical protein [Ancylobacter sp. 3268]MDR6953144.1 hypothetical protein [Ancylobacter sp. 3268]